MNLKKKIKTKNQRLTILQEKRLKKKVKTVHRKLSRRI